MTTATRTPPHHDTLTCYADYRCRRPECVERYRAWSRDRYHAKAKGTWTNLLDAEPVREHLLALQAAGITIHRIAAITGMPYNSVRSYTQSCRSHPRRHRITPTAAEKILAIDPETTRPSRVDPTGARRRIEALVAIGWPTIRIAERAGFSPANRTCIFNRPTILLTTAQGVTEAYEEMRHQKPARHGVSATSIKRAKKRAAERRWPPPKYWDETGAIDDPDFTPGYRVTKAEILAEEARWLMDTAGYTRAEVAGQLGISLDYVHRALAENPVAAAA
ncbi:hypothetical protein [Streptomyces sp. DW26H14]|uniref:hypothetical protein n=1 Tax=Streptomyces sp. DW26H14 TaxID=3435395 RepID=UPI00403DE576